MSLQHLPGVELLVEEVEEDHDVLAQPGMVDDVDEDEVDEPLLDIDARMVTDIANAVANVIIRHIDNVDTLPDEKVRFFYEEITDAIEHGLETADFSVESFEMWYNINNIEAH